MYTAIALTEAALAYADAVFALRFTSATLKAGVSSSTSSSSAMAQQEASVRPTPHLHLLVLRYAHPASPGTNFQLALDILFAL